MIERAIAAVSPQWALSRHKARVATAMTGGYTGAGYRENMAYWTPGVGDSDTDVIRDLRELRARSRDLVRNSPIAGGAIETQVSHVVGTGLSLQSRIDAKKLGLDDDAASEWQTNTEREFQLWCESEYADAYGQQNFYELQDLAFRSRLESGDAFVVLASKKRPEWPFTLALQIVEADRVSNPDNKGDTPEMTQGIERDSTGAPVAAHISDRHPGAYGYTKDAKWTRVAFRGKTGRRNVLHLMRKIRPGQTRGIPELAPIIETLKQLTRYSTAEVDAAVNSATIAMFAKMDPDTFTDVFDDDAQKKYMSDAQRWDGTLRSGAVVNLLPGEEITSPMQNRPNPNFDGFFSAVMGQIGVGLNIPKEVLMKHFQSSYSAARAALLDAWRTFRIRREWLASKLCQPTYEEWLADAVAMGRISAPGFFADPAVRKAWSAAKWIGDGPGAIDPAKEASAAKTRLEIGLTTLAEEIVAYDGGDWETKHRQQVRERDERVEGGLAQDVSAPMPGQVMPGQMPGAAKPGAKPEQDDEDAPEQEAMAHHTHIHLPQGLELSIPAPVVNVQPPAVTVEVAAPVVHVAAPAVNVEAVMPEQKAPVVIQTPAPSAASKGFHIVKDSAGRIAGIEPN